MIQVKSLSKIFRSKGREVRALDDLSFESEDVGATALLGPNGAGKTTLLRVLSTAVIPSSGDAFVNGASVVKSPDVVRRMIGLVTSSERSFYFRLTGLENLVAFGILYNFKLGDAKRRAMELLDRVGLADWGDVEYMKYSLGMQRRLALARAMFHDPPVLLLDEPTLGIDVESAKNVISLGRELSREKTFLFTSHNMEEVQKLASRVCFISDGKLLDVGSLPRLREKHGLAADASMEEIYIRVLGEAAALHGPRAVRTRARWHE